MPSNPDWDLDRARGYQAELWIGNVRDALQNGSIEVKLDERAMSTGNIYVEFECRRNGKYQPSGIKTTKADIWIFVVQKENLALIIETRHLLSICEKPGVRIGEETDGTHPTRGYLIPMVYLVRPQK